MNLHLRILGLEMAQNRRQPRRSDTIITANIKDAGQDSLDGCPQVGGLLRSPDDFLKTGTICWPLADGRTPCLLRTSSGKPISFSSERIMRVIPDCV